MIKRAKKIMIILLTLTVVLSASAGAFAADNDGWTEASKTAAADNGEWEKWFSFEKKLDIAGMCALLKKMADDFRLGP